MGTRATGMWDTAPAEVLATTAVRPALRRLGITTPWAPAHSRRPDDRPQVVGVGQLVAEDDQGRFPLFLRSLEDVLDRGVFPNGGHGDNPLMGVGTGHLVQLPPVGVDHHHAVGSGSVGDVTQGAVCISLGQINFINGGTGTQCLDDRVASFNDAIRFGVPLRRAFAVFFHRFFNSLYQVPLASASVWMDTHKDYYNIKNHAEKALGFLFFPLFFTVYSPSVPCICLTRMLRLETHYGFILWKKGLPLKLNNNNKKNSGGKKNSPNIMGLISLVVWALIITALLNYFFSIASTANAVEVKFSDFISLVKEDKVEEVKLESNKYTFTLKKEAQQGWLKEYYAEDKDVDPTKAEMPTLYTAPELH